MNRTSTLIGFATLAVFAVVNIAAAATTINTNIQTDGTLAVTSTSTFAGATFSGIVGIGTTTPKSALAITSPFDTMLQINSDTPDSDGGGGINFQVGGQSKAFVWYEYYPLSDIAGFNVDDVAIGSGPGRYAFRVGKWGDVVINGGTDYQQGWAIPDPFSQPDGFWDASSTNSLTVGGYTNTSSTFDIYTTDHSTNPNFIVRDDGAVSVGTSTPVANFQVTTKSANATTTLEFGKKSQNKGTCLKLYRTDGSAIYAYIAAGTTAFTLTTTACASVTNF